MRGTAAKWGNSLGVRIPREIAQRVGMREGSRLEITEENGRIILVPQPPAAEDDPFTTFAEWNSEADRKAYKSL